MAALHNKPENFCHRMKYMRDYIKRAYEALPEYYRIRYETAMDVTFRSNRAAVESITGGR